MKLYTEEQVLNTVNAIQSYIEKFGIDGAQPTIKNHLKMLAQIELPSDEEIKSYSDRYSTMHEDVSDKLGQYLVSAIHIDGAKWMKEQILGKEDKTFKQKSKWTKV
jgi:H2-forming N5,N10-methylenetetrahydromethanopterin dehydrogenase-like enzyme